MDNPIKIYVPVKVTYSALEDVLKKQVVGEYIPKPDEGDSIAPYAQILDVRLEETNSDAYNIGLRIRLRVLRTVLKRDQVDLQVQVSLDYDNTMQQLFVRKFRLESKTSSGFYNTALEVLANKVAYNQILKKAKANLAEIIAGEVKKVNELLKKGLDLKGLNLLGTVNEIQVHDITPMPDHVSLSFELQGKLEVAISDLISFMPAK
ncbi:DUF4403 family protein [Pontibacter silvestris]|uniref:DUF4403 family protein n=1 Tax=Pontibacter silvestris TaxID=2305183 RepID=A0ABW4WT45_9BACT|nr:DUF4403 family protein [Pontibacter silvestris]MCC9136258.1 DUF4403 family protein [Pontibacter silvestris]